MDHERATIVVHPIPNYDGFPVHTATGGHNWRNGMCSVELLSSTSTSVQETHFTHHEDDCMKINNKKKIKNKKKIQMGRTKKK